MPTSTNKSRIGLIAGFGTSLLVLVFASVFAYNTVTSLLDSASWVNHTTEVEQGLEKVVSFMKDAETGQRGYLLTGNVTFLEPYETGRDSVWPRVEQVKRLTADNQQQQLTFDTLEGLIRNKLKLLAQTIDLKRGGGTVSTPTLDSGKKNMDAIRAVINIMIKREESLMKTRTAKFSVLSTETPYILLGASLLSIFLTIYFYRRLSHDYDRRKKLELELIARGEKINRQIGTINRVAKEVAEGNYKVRIDPNELE